MPSVAGANKKEPAKLKATSSKSNLNPEATDAVAEPAAKPPAPAKAVKEAEPSAAVTATGPEFVSFGQLAADLVALYQKHDFLLLQEPVAGLKLPPPTTTTTSTGAIEGKDEFVAKFELMIKRVAWCKRQPGAVGLLGFFSQTNVRVIQFYEMLVGVLSGCATAAELAAETSSGGVQHALFLNKTLEFLHLLTTNTSEEQDDDECTLMCRSFLARSYNFTSALCRLVLAHFSQAQSLANCSMPAAKTTRPTVSALIDDKVVYIAFGVLNRLVYDHKFFVVDSYVEQLVQLAVEKIIRKESKNMYFQFVANALRNHGAEIERLIKNSEDYKQFGRQLSFLIVERNLNPNLILNVLIILLKLYPEQTYGIPATSAAESGRTWSSSSSGVTQALSYENKRKIYDSFDLAMRVLSRNTTDAEAHKPAEVNEQTNSRLNALNLIYELVKCANVKQLFESNEDYSNVTLFKLNQLLIENDDESLQNQSEEPDEEEMIDAEGADAAEREARRGGQKYVRLPSSTFSIKVFKIFNELAVNSSRLACKLFKMVFVTKQFIENCLNENEKMDESSQNKLTKKLQLLILTSSKSKSKASAAASTASSTATSSAANQRKKKQSTSELDEQYNALFDFHLRLCKLTRPEETSCGDASDQCPSSKRAKHATEAPESAADASPLASGLEIASQRVMLLHLYEYLYNLFKKMQSVRENFYGTERNMNKFVGVLVENFNHLYAMHHLSSAGKFKPACGSASPADLCRQDQYDFSAKIYFYNLSIIHALTTKFTVSILDRKKLVSQVFDLLKQNTWMPTHTLVATDICMANAGNFMATTRLLIGFLFGASAGNRRAGNSDMDGFGGGGSEDDMIRNAVLIYLKGESTLRLVAQVLHQSSRKELAALAYELLFDLASLAKTENFNFSFESFATIGHGFMGQTQHDDLAELKLSPGHQSGANAGDLMARLNSGPGLGLPPANSALAKLFDHFNYKTSEQKKQEAKMINLLNTYFTNSLNHEIEMKVFKDQLLEYAQREVQLKQEIGAREHKIAELKLIAEQHLSEMKSLREQYSEQKKDLLQMEKDHAGAVQKLERALSSEVKTKMEMQKTYEAKTKELEASVEKLETDLKAKTAELESLRGETDKLKSILSYVKENFK